MNNTNDMIEFSGEFISTLANRSLTEPLFEKYDVHTDNPYSWVTVGYEIATSVPPALEPALYDKIREFNDLLGDRSVKVIEQFEWGEKMLETESIEDAADAFKNTSFNHDSKIVSLVTGILFGLAINLVFKDSDEFKKNKNAILAAMLIGSETEMTSEEEMNKSKIAAKLMVDDAGRKSNLN